MDWDENESVCACVCEGHSENKSTALGAHLRRRHVAVRRLFHRVRAEAHHLREALGKVPVRLAPRLPDFGGQLEGLGAGDGDGRGGVCASVGWEWG